MDGAENADIQGAFAAGIQQVIDGQAAEVVKQPAVDLKQGPQRIGESEDQVYPVAIRQAVKLGGNPQVSGFFTAGRAGVGDVFNMPAAGIIAAIFLHAADAGAAGKHFGDGLDFDIAQTASIQQGGPALVSCEKFFERAGTERGRLTPALLQISATMPRVLPHSVSYCALMSLSLIGCWFLITNDDQYV